MVVIRKKLATVPKTELPAPVIDVRKQDWKPTLNKIHDKYYGGKPTKKEVSEMAVKVKVGAIKKEVVAKKEAVKAKKGKTIDEIWVDILSAAVGKNLQDKEIAKQMEQACPGHKYTEASVAGHRSGYNCGRFPSQKGVKPKAQLERYQEKKKAK
jgi:hypothetical protein